MHVSSQLSHCHSANRHVLYQNAHNFENIPTCIISEHHTTSSYGRLYFIHSAVSSCRRLSCRIVCGGKIRYQLSCLVTFLSLKWEITQAWWSPGVPFLFNKQTLYINFIASHVTACFSLSERNWNKRSLLYVRRNPSYVQIVSKMFRLFWAIKDMRLLCNDRKSPKHVGDRL